MAVLTGLAQAAQQEPRIMRRARLGLEREELSEQQTLALFCAVESQDALLLQRKFGEWRVMVETHQLSEALRRSDLVLMERLRRWQGLLKERLMLPIY